MNIERGKKHKAQKVCIHGVEGIGKSTFASKFPDPFFIDTEGSTSDLDVTRTCPSSWAEILSTIGELRQDHQGFRTTIVDTIDWAERYGVIQCCAENGLSSLGGQEDYGKSYNAWAALWGKFLDSLSDLADTGMHIVLCAHTQIRKQELPDQFGSFDHYELKLEKKTAAMTKEWARMLLFMNYKTTVIQDEKTKKAKAFGSGERVVYTTRTGVWDAKNRLELPPELPLDYAQFSHIFDPPIVSSPPRDPVPAPVPAPAEPPAAGALGRLQAMMQQSSVTVKEVQDAIASKGHYPAKTLLNNLDPAWIDGYMLPKWQGLIGIINKQRAANTEGATT